MSTQDNPLLIETSGGEVGSWVTLRDIFAGLAMQAAISNSCMIENLGKDDQKWLADHAYATADAMLEARNSNDH